MLSDGCASEVRVLPVDNCCLACFPGKCAIMIYVSVWQVVKSVLGAPFSGRGAGASTLWITMQKTPFRTSVKKLKW